MGQTHFLGVLLGAFEVVSEDEDSLVRRRAIDEVEALDVKPRTL